MKKKITFVLVLAFIIGLIPDVANAKLVACVGDSITWGEGLPDRESNCYPAQLATILQSVDSDWETQNFGHSGATLLRNKSASYVIKTAYSLALASEPDVVVIMLGTNDCARATSSEIEQRFISDYLALIDDFAQLPSQPRIFVCNPPPIFLTGFGYNNTVLTNQIIPRIEQLPTYRDVEIIDLYTPLENSIHLFSDGLHPNTEGAGMIAETVASMILGFQFLPDFNGDEFVDINDLLIMIDNWSTDNSLCDIAPPPEGDGIVDALDLDLLMSYWGQEIQPPPELTLVDNEETWTTKSPMSTARYVLSSSVVDGIIYAIGGDAGSRASVVEAYEPVTDTWTRKSNMPMGRGAGASSVVNGRIYYMGGRLGANGANISSVIEYDPTTDTWTTKANMIPTPRTWLSSSVVNGKIYAIGGAQIYQGKPLSTVEEYNPATDTWTSKTDMPTARTGVSTSAVNGKIYAIGGSAGYSQWYQGLTTVEEYDPAMDTWTKKADMPIGRTYFSTCAVNGKIYAIGGLSTSSNHLSQVDEYDPATDTWTRVADMPSARSGVATSAVNGKIYAIGGWVGTSTILSTVEEYDLYPLVVDFNGDEFVDINDLLIMIDNWSTDNSLCDIAPRPFGDGIVDALDLELLMDYWGQEINLPNSPPAGECWIEAEAADSITAPMKVFDDPNASGGQYIAVEAGNNSTNNPPDTGIATYTITVQGGVYKINARIIAPSGINDSFWFNIPGATTQTMNHTSGWVRWNSMAHGADWHWDIVHSTDDGNTEVEWTMDAGTYTLEIAYREDGAQIDALVISKVD